MSAKNNPKRAKNQWLAQLPAIERLKEKKQAEGTWGTRKDNPLTVGSIVSTISFFSASSQPPSNLTSPDSSDKQPREVSDDELGQCASEEKAGPTRVNKIVEQNIAAETGSVAELFALGSTGSPFNAEASQLLGEISARAVKLGAGYSKDVIACIREATGTTKEQLPDAQLKPFAIAALKAAGAFKSRPKATFHPSQPIASLPLVSIIEPSHVPRSMWRVYGESAFMLLVGQSFALFAAAYVTQLYVTATFGNNINWKDAIALITLLPGFLLLGVWTLTVMEQRPESMSVNRAAIFMRVYLIVAAILSWWLITSPIQGWSTWAAIFGAFSATYARFRKHS